MNGSIPRKKTQIYPGGNGHESYELYSAAVFETQHYPDSVNHPSWPTTVLKKGETYRQKAVFKLSL